MGQLLMKLRYRSLGRFQMPIYSLHCKAGMFMLFHFALYNVCVFASDHRVSCVSFKDIEVVVEILRVDDSRKCEQDHDDVYNRE
mmetsp:Transcript_32780/g.59170  ORF Transcript_32780/g.59170 Transcript_32780/m.59170 type:complete len:84 (-) Transcript_32780:31-282(-)